MKQYVKAIRTPLVRAGRPGRRRAGLLFALAPILVLASFATTSASAEPPSVSMGSATSPSYTSVHVTGEVDPEGELTEWFFQVSSDGGSSWERSSLAGFLEGSGAQPVAGDLEGLHPGTTYRVRLAAYNFTEFVEVFSPEPSPEFSTEAVAPPSVSIAAPTAVTATGAHFSGEIDPESPAGDPPAYDVNWSFHCSPECPGVSGGTIPADSSSHTVEADA